MNWLRLLSLLSIAIGLSISHSLISIGVGGLALLPFFQPFRQKLRETFLFWRLLYFPFALLYLLHGLSLIYTDDIHQWLIEMRIKVPFLFLLPTAMAAWLMTSENEKKLIHLAYHVSLLGVGLATFLRMLFNYEWALEEIRHSRYVPMVGGISHIYYSALALMGLFFSWTFPIYGSFWIRVIISCLYLVLLHGLALRTGLGALYGTAAIMILFWVLRYRQGWWWGLIGIGLLVGMLIAFIQWVPPLQRRWWSLREDLALYQQGRDLTHASVGRRLAALEASWRVFLKNPLFGVGIADNQVEVFAEISQLPYQWKKETYILPHNQFVEYAIGLGLIGVGVFIAFWVGALWGGGGIGWVGWLGAWFLIMQVEAILERQIGVTAFLWGTGLLRAHFYLTGRKL
ncbi:MAG: O-antigen ligase family protein [Bacteroidia bacterium]|nr:O-antigen ligase family protein [Bacteroidia bacterium]